MAIEQEVWAERVAADLQRIDGRSAAMASALEQYLIAQRLRDAQQKDDVAESRALAVIEALHNHSRQYTQIICALGYGGLLTLWSTTYKKISMVTFGGAGFMLTVSLLVFILGEMFGTHSVREAMREIGEYEVGGRRATAREQLDYYFLRVEERTSQSRGFFFWFPTISGFAGGTWLAVCLLYRIFGPV